MAYTYYYTMEYLPKRFTASQQQVRNRQQIYNFKDGKSCPIVINNLIQAINRITAGNKSQYVIGFIPASTQQKTHTRFHAVSLRLKSATGVNAFVDLVTRRRDTEAGHISGKSSNPAADFSVNRSYCHGKKVILIDDVITRGVTFSDTAKKIQNEGATAVIGLFVGKTVSPGHSPHSMYIMGNLWKSTLDVESSRQVRYDEFYDPYDEWMDQEARIEAAIAEAEERQWEEEARIEDAIARAEERQWEEEARIEDAIAEAEEAYYEDFIEPDYEDYYDGPY